VLWCCPTERSDYEGGWADGAGPWCVSLSFGLVRNNSGGKVELCRMPDAMKARFMRRRDDLIAKAKQQGVGGTAGGAARSADTDWWQWLRDGAKGARRAAAERWSQGRRAENVGEQRARLKEAGYKGADSLTTKSEIEMQLSLLGKTKCLQFYVDQAEEAARRQSRGRGRAGSRAAAAAVVAQQLPKKDRLPKKDTSLGMLKRRVNETLQQMRARLAATSYNGDVQRLSQVEVGNELQKQGQPKRRKVNQ
jgi:hypothetical protein